MLVKSRMLTSKIHSTDKKNMKQISEYNIKVELQVSVLQCEVD